MSNIASVLRTFFGLCSTFTFLEPDQKNFCNLIRKTMGDWFMQISQISAQLKRSKNIHVKDHWLKQCYQFLTKFKKDISGLALVEKYFSFVSFSLICILIVQSFWAIFGGGFEFDWDWSLTQGCFEYAIRKNTWSTHSPSKDKILNYWLVNLILQVIEIVNVGGSLEKRFEDSANRLLKIFLTDGVQNGSVIC